MRKKIWLWAGVVAGVFILFLLYFFISVRVPAPKVNEAFINEVKVSSPDTNFYVYKNNWLRKSNSGLWEMYVEGGPFERGVIAGKLSRELIEKQEVHFIDMLNEMIPSKAYINFLKYLVAWFNRNLDDNIPEEYKKEIYGISRSASPGFDYIGPAYYRMLNYHGAHDIGHFLQEIHLVGCTSFAAWGDKSEDSGLIIGRNWDFFVGDGFAEDKIVEFVNPDQGKKFMMVTWGGMIGAVSGMNEDGLTVTINAARSEPPLNTATPVALLAREVLQYASGIEDAHKIIASRKTFVGQSFMIGSAKDKKAVVIEKTPETTAVFATHQNYLVCANHYQSHDLFKSAANQEQIRETSTLHRYWRMQKLVEHQALINPGNTAEILRDTKGYDGENIGFGNERALNQLQGHHSVIFQPEKGLAWISTAPWQAGKFVCYDLKKVFSEGSNPQNKEIQIDSLSIPEDELIETKGFQDYLVFRSLKTELQKIIKSGDDGEAVARTIVSTNPDYYLAYQLAGNYFFEKKKYQEALDFYKEALKKPIGWKSDSLDIVNKLQEIETQLK